MAGNSSGRTPILKLQQGNAAEAAGEGPAGTWEAYEAAARAYPARSVPPAVMAQAKATYMKIVRADARRAKLARSRGFQWDDDEWQDYGPQKFAFEPGVLAFSGVDNHTASRAPALLIDPDCGRKHQGCRMWVGASGGGVWLTENALKKDPKWFYVTDGIQQNSVGQLVLDPNDWQNKTLYLGTGEGNRCSSGCEAGVGIYKSTDGGDHWKKLADKCVSNATYPCVTPGKDAFLGRGINAIVIDPKNPKHILVGSAQAVRGLSHVIGNVPTGSTSRAEPGANAAGVYESTDGGKTFTMVWNGNSAASFGVTDVGLDPLDNKTVYAAAFDQGVWRRDAGAGQTAFQQVFAPRFVSPPIGQDRQMIALTVKNGHTRIYLTDGTGNTGTNFAEFWRTDDANQSAAALLASQTPGLTVPAGDGNPFPATYNGWQRLTSSSTASPYFATNDFCTGQCWYDQDVITPKGKPDTVYVIGSFQYGELPCTTTGVGCGNGRSNGRAVLYSDTAGDPDAAHDNRTFTDMTYDAQQVPSPWCALPGISTCTDSPNSIHPDQHELVINPSNPTQFFESSDGGVIRTSGSFTDTSAKCTGARVAGLTPNSIHQCQRLLSRVPTELAHINRNYGNTLQFINVAINPSLPCEVMGGTQDNGTWSNNNGCSKKVWPQVIYGDGGNAGYDATNATWRFNEFTGGFSDSNFRNGDPTKWVITSAPLVNSGEPFAFYWPQVGDPNPVPGTHPIYSGGLHVWRTWAFGAGTPGAVPQDTVPNIAFYEANCPEFTTPGNNPACGDYQPLGGPQGPGTPGDLTGAVYGADRGGGSMSWIARDGADHGTIWAATSAGRIFVTHNGDAVNPADVLWHRIDSSTSGNSPTRFPSGIYPDPADPTHAWISYSGYNAVTPTTPGHLFDVHEGGSTPGSGTFTNLNIESGASAFPTPTDDGDLPATDIVRDDATHTLYVGTDFGVLRGKKDGTAGWHVTQGMPRFEITHLEIEPSSRVPTCVGMNHCPRILYAATHSQGIWRMKLGG
jgi:hypothetical protein